MDQSNAQETNYEAVPPPTSDLIIPQLMRTQSAEELSPPTDLCRICLSNQTKLISPCNCKGSIEKVHESCLSKWILNGKTYDCFTYETQREVQCQLCHCPISFYLYKKKKCGLENFYKNLRFQRAFVIVHIVLMLLFIVCLAVMVKAIADTIRKSGNLRMEEPTFIVVTTLCGIVSFFLVGLTYRLVIQNFIYTKFTITKVFSNQELRQKQETRQGTQE